jgi:hypothetical protein
MKISHCKIIWFLLHIIQKNTYTYSCECIYIVPLHMYLYISNCLDRQIVTRHIENEMLSLGQGFLTLALLTFRARQLFIMGGCSLHGGVLISIPGLYSLDVSNPTHTRLWQPKLSPDNYKIAPGKELLFWMLTDSIYFLLYTFQYFLKCLKLLCVIFIIWEKALL